MQTFAGLIYMKNKQTKSEFMPVFILCFFLACLGMGCLGLSGGDNANGGYIINPKSNVSISGRVYFKERQLYGNIPITVKNMLKEPVAMTTTDEGGYYSFEGLPDGIYYVSANTGESEVTFGNMVQVTSQGATELGSIALLCVTDVIVDKISSSSFHIDFHTNRSARASLEYGPVGGYQKSKTIGQSGQTHHETTISDLNILTDYEVTLYITGDDGQEFCLNGLTATTLGVAGPYNLAFNINNGAYETTDRTVTLYMQGDDCDEMRISETLNMDESPWLAFSNTYQYTFANSAAGIKRIYVQFRNSNGTLSPIESDSIIYTDSGYVGIWLNNGESVTNKSTVKITAVFPGASQMLISDSPNFTNAYWETYTYSRKWTFNSEDGIKNIYCKFKGGKANPNEVFQASIVYDKTPPKVEILINNGSSISSSKYVNIVFKCTSEPSHMKITNESEPSNTSDWEPFRAALDWELASGDGQKTVYAIFKDAAGNQFGPISAKITLDTVAPTGNTISINETDLPTSSVATYSLLEDLPKYVHFSVSDVSTHKCYYAIGLATTTVPTEFNVLFAPFNVLELNTSNVSLGDNKIWAYFADEAGNEGLMQTAQIRIEGPDLEISPTGKQLITGEELQLTATPINISPEMVGTINWHVASGSGTISSSGVYKAPAPIYQEENILIKADSALIPTLSGIASISLKTTVEITYLQTNGQYTLNPVEIQVRPGEKAVFTIYTLHTPNGIQLISNPSVGYTEISQPVAAEFGSISTITYTSPTNLPNGSVVPIKFCAIDNTNIIGTVNCIVSTGASITLTKSAEIAQRNLPVNITASISNTELKTVKWELNPPGCGSFDENDPTVYTKTTLSPEHVVTFYASTPEKIQQASITATIGEASRSTNLAVYPPLSLNIDPIATYAMPITQPMIFNVNSFEYMIPDTDETLIWEYKNANSADFMPADGKTYADRGKLTIVSNSMVEYIRPNKLPSSMDSSASDSVLIRATSKADSKASSTAIVSLAEKVMVKIYDDVEKNNEVKEAATVIEVGSLQFYAQVTPEIIGNTTVTWSVTGDGTIDSNGKYTAPNELTNNKLKIRATSNYDTSAYGDVEITLSNFWVPKRDNMFDSTTGEPMQVSTIFVDPRTRIGEDFVVYAGTSAESKFGYYGLWVATFSDQIGDTSGGYWTGIPELSSPTRSPDSKYLIYSITMTPNGEIYASTGNGLYHIPERGTNPYKAEKLSGKNGTVNASLPTEPLFSIDSAVYNNKVAIVAGTNAGVYLLTLSDPTTIESCELLIDTQSSYKNETMETHTDNTASPAITVEAYSALNIDNPILSIVRTLKFDNMNKSLYFGTANNMIYFCPSLASNMTKVPNQKVFLSTDPSSIATTISDIYFYKSLSYPRRGSLSGIPLSIAIDTINTNTVWAATTAGVSRSLDYGNSWQGSSFGGTNTNCRCVIVDPNNTINVMAGSEDGLYRTTNGGSSWTRIRSGLGNYKTITCLTQAAGAANQRRKVWVGTSGGVFVGKQSLALE